MLHIDLVERDDLSGEIYRQTKRAIISNILRPGDALPATRELARTLSVARTTVVIAYERLEADGFIQSRQGAGTFVRGSTQATNSRSRRIQLRALAPRPIWDAIPLPTAFDRSALFDFRTGAPDASLFPHRHWRKLISSALREIEKSANGVYPSPAGHVGLRQSIARHVGVSRGIAASADDVVITGGTQQAIDLIARVLLSPDDRIAVEDPCYEAARRAFEAAGARIVGVPVDDDGLIVDALPADVKAVYVTPSHQYPLTVTMTLDRRRALLDWASRNNAAIIEDDYDGEFRFEGRPLEALQTLDVAGRVIYVGSFSKTLLPTLRLGFVILPNSLRSALQRAKYVSDWTTSTLEQAALSRLIDDGGFVRHLKRARRVYSARHQRIVDTMASDFSHHLKLMPSTTGLHVAAMAKLASVDELAAVAARASSLGVEVNQVSSFAVGGAVRPGLMLGYGAIATEQIDEGLRRLRSSF
tara:strand:- start:3676 stop:5094 length:1419 start_codon:yes stop_codon:yes gene_type:complete